MGMIWYSCVELTSRFAQHHVFLADERVQKRTQHHSSLLLFRSSLLVT